MRPLDFFDRYFSTLGGAIATVDAEKLAATAELMKSTSQRGGKVLITGNGGSAAMSSHVAVDLTKNARIRALNFSDADLITCFVNDFGADRWVEKAIEFYADPIDMAVLISTSGKSRNILNGARQARAMGLPVVTFSGCDPDNPLRGCGDPSFWVDSKAYNIVEMTHHVWLLAIVDYIIGRLEYPAC